MVLMLIGPEMVLQLVVMLKELPVDIGPLDNPMLIPDLVDQVLLLLH